MCTFLKAERRRHPATDAALGARSPSPRHIDNFPKREAAPLESGTITTALNRIIGSAPLGCPNFHSDRFKGKDGLNKPRIQNLLTRFSPGNVRRQTGHQFGGWQKPEEAGEGLSPALMWPKLNPDSQFGKQMWENVSELLPRGEQSGSLKWKISWMLLRTSTPLPHWAAESNLKSPPRKSHNCWPKSFSFRLLFY